MMTFENGWSISVRWGKMNHCENKWDESEPTGCRNAEVAVMNELGQIINFGSGDSVLSHVSPEEVSILMEKVREQWASNECHKMASKLRVELSNSMQEMGL